MITKSGNPLAPRKCVVSMSWKYIPPVPESVLSDTPEGPVIIPATGADIELSGASLAYTSDGYTPIGKVDVGQSTFTMNFENPTPLPPQEYIPLFDSTDDMLRWVIGYLYETPQNKSQLGAD